MSNVIKFADARDRAVKEAYYKTCEDLYDKLVNVLCNVEAGDNQLAGVTVTALVDVLEAGGMNRKVAKVIIARAMVLI